MPRRLAVAAGMVALLGALLPTPSVLADDVSPPTVTNPVLSPNPVAPGALVSVTATATDDVAVASAEMSVDSAAWLPMATFDGAFGDPSETLTGSVGSTALQVVAGGSHSCALLTDGSVDCWGANASGQLGDGTILNRLSPVPVPDLADIGAVAAGGNHTCALGSDGSVLCWGTNNAGQLGDGTTTPRLSPVPVLGLGSGSGVVALTTGGSHTCALRADGSVLCWGTNNAGQLGDGTTTPRLSPVPVLGLGSGSGVSALTAGGNHTCALLADGSVDCWGANGTGQLGDGTTTNRLSPVQVHDPSSPTGYLMGVVALAAGGSHTCALLADGSVDCWGANGTGQLGDGTTAPRLSPVQVHDPSSPTGFLSGVVALTTGGSHTCAAHQADGSVLCWGADASGQLGDGTATSRLSPVPVPGLSGVSEPAAGGNHTCALLADGSVDCWGANDFGQLGDGTKTSQYNPVLLPSLVQVGALAAGGSHTCALLADGSVDCWGANNSGQIGDGTTTGRFSPVAVLGLGSGSGVSALTAGGSHTCALLADGSVDCWGANGTGQLGDGTTAPRLSPVQVHDPSSPTGFLSGVSALAAGVSHTCALLADGSVDCWGANGTGQLGDGTTTNRLSPVQVHDPSSPGGFLSGVIALTTGGSHTCGLRADGSVLCWGANASGQLGDGTTLNRLNPVAVPGLGAGSGVSALAAGGSHTCALLADGSVDCWGANGTGQLGDGTTAPRLSPVQVHDPSSPTGFLSGVVALTTGGSHTCALLADGSVDCWGANGTGQLGDGTTTNRLSPVQVPGLSGVSAIAAGGGDTCAALQADGSVLCWGADASGQLGDGTALNRFSPVPVLGLGALTDGSHSVCVRATDSVGNVSDGTACTTLTVGVGPPTLTSIAVTPASPTIAAGTDQQFTATGTYSDATIADLTSSVNWASATPAVATINAAGLAHGVSPGTSTISATLAAVSDSTLLTVGPRTLTSIAVTPASPTIAAGTDQQFTATGTYSDATIADLTSSVSWASATPAVATISAAGLAHGVSPGTSTISATLGAVSDSTLLTVTKPIPVLTYTGSAEAAPGASITLSATLRTGSGTAISGKTVTFTLNGATLMMTTNRSGVASVKTKAPAPTGSYPIGVNFAGDTTYAAASASATLVVRIATKLTYTGPTKVVHHAQMTLSATLKVAGGAALPGKTVTFTLNGATLTATTNASGVASVQTLAPDVNGSYPITVTFAGDATYSPSLVTATLRVG